ncbi:hypothetical protein B0F90DRAFT_1779489, partial [Multifurca ochricompacta]
RWRVWRPSMSSICSSCPFCLSLEMKSTSVVLSTTYLRDHHMNHELPCSCSTRSIPAPPPNPRRPSMLSLLETLQQSHGTNGTI